MQFIYCETECQFHRKIASSASLVLTGEVSEIDRKARPCVEDLIHRKEIAFCAIVGKISNVIPKTGIQDEQAAARSFSGNVPRCQKDAAQDV